jgi:ABC-type transport system involved in multi-copper enzyme maturation permease subunit
MTAAARPMSSARRGAAREFGAAVRTIMVKELRGRFRGRRAFVVLTIYLGLLALLAYGTYVLIAPTARQASQLGGAPNASASIGIGIFTVLSFFQLLLVCFIAPAFTTGAISLEREKQTLDLLISTPLRPGAIVVGKLLAALAYIGLMILAAIPISAIVFMYGGATVDDLVRQQVVLLVTALGLGAIGLFFSAMIKRTQAATVLTYCAVLVLTIGTVLIWVFFSILAQRDAVGISRRAPEEILWVNPALAMIDVVAGTEAGNVGGWSSFLSQITGEQITNAGGGVICKGDACFQSDDKGNVIGPGSGLPGAPADLSSRPFGGAAVADIACPAGMPPDQCVANGGRPIAAVGQPESAIGHFWPRYSITIAVMAVLATLLSMRLVVPAGMRFVFRRPRRQPVPAPPAPGTVAVEPSAPSAVTDGPPDIATAEDST